MQGMRSGARDGKREREVGQGGRVVERGGCSRPGLFTNLNRMEVFPLG